MIKKQFLFIFLFVSSLIVAQNDTIKKEINRFSDFSTIRTVDAKIIEKKLEDLPDETPLTDLVKEKTILETDLLDFLDKKDEKLPLSYKKSKYVNPNDDTPKREILMQPKPLDDDVLVVKHFNGKNISRTNLKTTQNLGTIKTNTKYVRIEYRDFGRVDGDRVRVFLNEKEIESNIHLSGLYYTIEVKLDKKGYNRIDIQAINQGSVGPNTAEFVVYDDRGSVILHKAWNLLKGNIATLGFIRF